MATTTQILFNSPALHSLKRDQLVKLCKIHSVKANGKNAELIERLKQHAQALPPEALDAPEDVDENDAMEVEEEDDEDDDPREHGPPGGFPSGGTSTSSGMDEDEYAMQDVVLTSRFGIPRPSEQWEVVMDDIAEADESAVGTMSSKGSLRTVSNGEFGTQSSKEWFTGIGFRQNGPGRNALRKEHPSVSSSLKAFATSLGIKRTTSKSSQAQEHDGSTNSKSREGISPSKLFHGKARDSLVEHATPYAQIPPAESLPDTDEFKFSTPDASILGADDADDNDDALLARSSSRSVRPAPVGARLSTGVGQSTVRLVTRPVASRVPEQLMSPPHLTAIQPDFNIKMGTPSAGRVLSVWPASPRTVGADTGNEGRLYPQLPLEDLKAARRQAGDEAGESGDDDGPMPGGMSASTPARTRTTTATTTKTATPRAPTTPGPVYEPDMFSPAKRSAAATTSAAVPPASGDRPSIPRSAPFLFGSPLPRRDTPKSGPSAGQDADSDAGVSNTAFEGRLTEAQKERELNGEAKPAASTHVPSNNLFGGLLFGGGAALDSTGAGAADRFAKAHDAQFAKMDSIANHYAARRPTGNNRKRKSDALGPGAAAGPRAGQKRRSSAAGTRVISNGVRKHMGVPGGFGGDDAEESESEDEDEDAARNQARGEHGRDEVEDMGARRSSKRMRITAGWDVHQGQRVSIAPPLAPAEEEKKRKEKDAAKRELDAMKARRRSSRGRQSLGGKAAAPAKGKTSRFGFLSSAKSIVRNVWNMGGGTKAKPAAATSSIPVPKAPAAPSGSVAASKIDHPQKNGKAAGGANAASKNAAAAPSAAQNTRKPSGTHSRIPSVSSTSGKLLKPVPPAGAADAKTTGTVTSTRSNTSRSRSPLPSFSQSSAQSNAASTNVSRPGSIAGTTRPRMGSTSGTATTASRQPSRTSTVSSMGTRSSLVSGTSSTAVSSVGTRRSLASTNTLASTSSKADASSKAQDMKEHQVRKRTSSLLAPTASSLAKVSTAARPSASGRTSGLPTVSENKKRPTAIPGPSKSPASARMSSMSPLPTRIFSQPLTNFGSPSSAASPAQHPSLGAAAATLMSADGDSPSKIPRPAVIPPKPKTLVARRPRISRSRVIAKVGAQRAAAAQGSSASSPNGRTRSSFGARRSFGGVKSGRASAGSDIMRGAAKKRAARQSEYIRRKSRAGTGEND
ncbi:hypothetical protein BD413DRAFT_492412 [Trametes elegans]|nr:hypothetical protein BD413DRAFT_492412 [Trametes elegans]